MDENKFIEILNNMQDEALAEQLYKEFKALPHTKDGNVDTDAWQAFIKAKTNILRNTHEDFAATEKSMEPVAKQIRDYAENIDFLNQNPTYKAGLAKRFGISVEELDKELNSIIKAKEYQAGRERRAKEIKEAGLLSLWTLASDYSKQRYIDDPDASIFGKEGDFNPLSTQGQDELRDVILGGFGAVGDVLPGVGGILIGPGFRAGRDVANYGGRYGKDVGTIINDVGTDALFNAGTQLLPTTVLRTTGKLGKGGAKTAGGKIADAAFDASKILDMAAEDKAIRESLKNAGWLGIDNSGKAAVGLLNAKDAAKKIARMPDSPLKRELQAAGSWDDQLEIIIKYNEELSRQPGYHNMYGVLGGYNKDAYDAVKNTYGENLANRALERETYDDVSKLAKGMAATSKVFNAVGEPSVKILKTAAGRGTDWKEPEDKKHERWQKGFATWDELKTDEYQTWLDANLKGLAK